MSSKYATQTTRRSILGFDRHHPPRTAAIRLDENSWSRKTPNSWIEPAPSLVDQVMRELWTADNPARFVLVYNAIPTLVKTAGLELAEAVEAVRGFRRKLCDAVYTYFTENFLSVINPEGVALETMEGGIDGFGVNVTPTGNFYSTKQLHFDIVEPLGSNLYGPNQNVVGGFPVFADALAYCDRNGLRIADILEKIPGERVPSLKPPHYMNVVEEFSVAFDVDMVNDMPFSIILNRVVEAGVMHGATSCEKAVSTAEVQRPLVHYEYVNTTTEVADAWYAGLGMTNTRAEGERTAKTLVPANVHPAALPFVIQLKN